MATAISDEYLVYGYVNYNIYNFGRNKWQFLSKDIDAENSFAEALKFYGSHNFERVEIKKKFFDERQKKFRLKTIEVLDKRKQTALGKIVALFLIIVTILGLLNISGLLNF